MITSIEANIDLEIDDRPVVIISSSGLSLIFNFHTVRDAFFVYRQLQKGASLTGVDFLLLKVAKRENVKLLFQIDNQEVGSIQNGQPTNTLGKLIGIPNARFHFGRVIQVLLRTFFNSNNPK